MERGDWLLRLRGQGKVSAGTDFSVYNEGLTAQLMKPKSYADPIEETIQYFNQRNKLRPSKRASKTSLKYHTLQPSFAHAQCNFVEQKIVSIRNKDIHTGCLLLSQKQIGLSNSK
ncbi:hypothetical protein ACB092_02G154200 [Castanea dentata]